MRPGVASQRPCKTAHAARAVLEAAALAGLLGLALLDILGVLEVAATAHLAEAPHVRGTSGESETRWHPGGGMASEMDECIQKRAFKASRAAKGARGVFSENLIRPSPNGTAVGKGGAGSRGVLRGLLCQGWLSR